MATVDVLNWQNKKVGTVELKPEVFESEVRKDVIHSVVRWQLACKRQGTHKTKTRAEVSGGGRKPFKQKGTGNARQGSIRSPLKPGGGIIFGPTPRDYSYVLPKKFKKLALRSTLSYLLKNDKLKVIEDMSSTDGKTKELAQRLKGFGTTKSLLVDADVNAVFQRAAQNIKGFLYSPVAGLNVYDLLKYDHVILTKSSIDKITERCEVN